MRLSTLFRLLLWTYILSNSTTSINGSQHTQVQVESSIEADMMGDETSHRSVRMKWTEKMCVDLLVCKAKAVELNNSTECPLKANGRKEGLMNLTLKFWNEMGYRHLQRTAQNLRDKISHIEKTMKPDATEIANEIQNQQEQRDVNTPEMNNASSESEECINNNAQHTAESEIHENLQSLDEMHIAIKQLASEKFEELRNNTPGNWEGRDINTFTKNKPNKKQLQQLNCIMSELIKSDPKQNPTEFLWESNCAMYATVRAWKQATQVRKGSNNNGVKENQKYKPQWLTKLENKMAIARKQISQISAEINRLKTNGRLTRKLRRNRTWMKKELRKTEIDLGLLAALKERKISIIKSLKNSKVNKLKSMERKKINSWFDQDERSFYKHLRDLAQNNAENDNPVYEPKDVKPANKENTLNKEDYKRFWFPIWQEATTTNLNQEWIRNTKAALAQAIPTLDNETVNISSDNITECLRSKRNWSAPGNDKLVNFWLKKFISIHTKLAVAINTMINERQQIPDWLSEGSCVMIPKKENPNAEDHRPITCLNTIYKLVTSIINLELQKHETKHRIMQIDQRGGTPGSMGCVDNLLIDKTILQDAERNRKNLSCTWIDVKKAFDSVSHEWLSEVLDMHRINTRIATFIRNIVKTWKITLKVQTCDGLQELGPVMINRGILQGDSFCVKLFNMCLNPIAWHLRSTEGYTLTHAKETKITHCLFVDDLKSFHKNQTKAATLTSNLQGMFNDIGLEWGVSKCAAVHIKRGKHHQTNNLPLTQGNNIPVLGEMDYYKFLGKFENTNHLDREILKKAGREYEKRLSLIWTSPLSRPRKIKATNTFAVPIMQYHMWSADWPIEELQKLDRNTRKIIADNKGKHHFESNHLLYLSPQKGGSGLLELEKLYKTTKIKTAHYITTNKDPRIQLVRSFQDFKQTKGLRSIIKDAITYAEQLGLNIEFNQQQRMTVINNGEKITEFTNCQPKNIKKELKAALERKYQDETINQPWLGNFVTQCWKDEDLSPDSFSVHSKWKNIPDVVSSIHTSILQQLVSTKVYKKKKLQESINDTTCRFCHSSEENIPHIMCSCSSLAQTLYKARHDRMLRPVYHQLLYMYNFESDIAKPWYKQKVPSASEENEDSKVLWDIPIHIDKAPSNGCNKPDITVYDTMSKKIILIEGTVCNIGTIQDRNAKKREKYTELRQGLKRLNPDYSITQINIVFDFLGNFNCELTKNLQELTGKKNNYDIIEKCQKWIISQNCEIIKKLHFT